MNDLYLFEDPDEGSFLVLHFPDAAGSMMALCGRHFEEDDLYLPDPDQSIKDFCPVCRDGWAEFKTSNSNNWRQV